MNLVGKIFVVLIFVLSLVQMSLTMTVYVTHTNWRLLADNSDPQKGPLGLKQRLEVAEADANKLRDEYTQFENRQEIERNEKRAALAALETHLKEEQAKSKRLQEELDDSRDKIRIANNLTNDAQGNAKRLLEENGRLRDNIKLAIDERGEMNRRNVILNDQYNDNLRATAELQKKAQSVSAELAASNAVLNHFNLKADVEYYRAQEPPQGVLGRVLAVNSDRKLVEISLGSDDGIRAGHRFEIRDASGSTYIGRVVVVEVFPEKAVCSNMAGFENGVYAVGNMAVPIGTRVGQ